ncbi:hypothetical protein MTR_4g026980 [Medicago truncatula]|uniref:Transmembrane protein n=1 Tax=Medicago truncatula TaxID=3880 RepID=G7JH28_MEDTR|nr:hypothetical protein MTR_4g026980 [Medicago truncatula]
MERASQRVVGCGRLSLVAWLCDATSACAKDRGGGCGAGTAAVEDSAMGDGTTLEGVAVGNNNSACHSNGITKSLGNSKNAITEKFAIYVMRERKSMENNSESIASKEKEVESATK